MKVIIEKQLEPNLIIGVSDYVAELNQILSAANRAKNESQLRFNMKEYFGTSDKSKHFSYGFGSSHMWVHEKNNNERLIFVPL